MPSAAAALQQAISSFLASFLAQCAHSLPSAFAALQQAIISDLALFISVSTKLVLGDINPTSLNNSVIIISSSLTPLVSFNKSLNLTIPLIFPLIKDWSNDEVWEYLIENENPWKHSNIELFHLYKGASPDSECPLLVVTGEHMFRIFSNNIPNENSLVAGIINLLLHFETTINVIIYVGY